MAESLIELCALNLADGGAEIEIQIRVAGNYFFTKLSTFDGSWSSVEFVKTYPRENPNDKYINSIRTKILCTKALFLYSKASLASAQSGTQVDMHIVEYIGVSS